MIPKKIKVGGIKKDHPSSYGAPEPVSEAKIIDNCFCERCPTKQGVIGAVDLRRRQLTTMRLEGTRTRSSLVHERKKTVF